ncbi:EF-hand domain-containing protein [Streptomyces sp. NBC_01408]|uniref:EF-hand domain-containing protein n=1 Tax=Streptomyces sp. NBC_01408 TaxID=2903855 RepID=UPI0022583861|nr:EF-hand domain-containing protein [Streptomyces sp. NBC_01408]MCX4693258.1 EF-hand domain-containing protein [Streptomyces sp. NBC_01408]
MTTDLLDRKLERAFTHLDADGSGGIDEHDIIALGSRLLSALAEPADSPKATQVMTGLVGFWQELFTELDLDRDGKVTPEEYKLGMTRLYADGGPAYDRSFRPMMEAFLTVVDTDGDGRISPEEFHKGQEAFDTRLSFTDTETLFRRIDTDGDGTLSVDELLAAVREYYTGTDEEAPGNLLFGEL